MKRAIVMLIFMMFLSDAFSQQVSNIIRGTVKDTLSGKPIPSATATIYMGRDSIVLSYGFTNNSGSFKFEALPFDTTLLIVVSHLGYHPFRTKFRLTEASPKLELNSILMSERSNLLKEVLVSAQRPPVFMQGDTLVVNPEAFKTKENAVVEDVLRKVPGIVVWADGKISVNGKYVSQLLVAGKPFFGGDPVVAIRNLPKEAIGKIKIYEDKNNGSQSENEPKVIMDITLKNGLNAGFFGKAGISSGTDKRHEGNVALNAFTPKNQLSVMAVTNNTNKEIFDVKSMLRQTVYKPGGNDNTNYQSNFTMEGLNSFKAGGINLDRDWSQTANSKMEYFRYNIDNKTEKNINQITTLDDGYFNMKTREFGGTSRQKQYFNTSFKDLKTNYEFRFEPLLEREKNIYDRTTETHTDRDNLPVSTNISLNNTSSDVKRININTEYIHKDKISLTQKYLLRYKLYGDDQLTEELLKTTFSNYNPSTDSDIDINRKKHLAQKVLNQSLLGEFNLNSLFKIGGRVNYKLTNTVRHIKQESQQQVDKFSLQTADYTIKDGYLTNKSEYKLVQERPGFEISTSKYTQGIRNRKLISLAALAELEYLNQNNESQKIFQQIDRNYVSFLPSVNFMYNYIKDGKFNKTYLLKYSTRIEIPTIEQLAPLIDSANQYYIRIGNGLLKKQYTNEIVFKYQNYRTKSAESFGFEIKAGLTQQKLVDSSIYDAAGRQVSYAVNANGYRYLTASVSYERSGRLFKNPLGIKLFPGINVSNNPYYIDGKLNVSKNFGASLVGMINYVQNDLLLYDLITNIMVYRNVVDSRKLHSTYLSTGGNIQLSWPKHTTIVNSVSYNLNANTYSKSIDYFIWNANIYYRLLKGEQLEIKLTATDLLKQRTNVIRYIDNNTIQNGIVNNLQQFFMIGLSYYPRHFGSKKSK